MNSATIKFTSWPWLHNALRLRGLHRMLTIIISEDLVLDNVDGPHGPIHVSKDAVLFAVLLLGSL